MLGGGKGSVKSCKQSSLIKKHKNGQDVGPDTRAERGCLQLGGALKSSCGGAWKWTQTAVVPSERDGRQRGRDAENCPKLDFKGRERELP